MHWISVVGCAIFKRPCASFGMGSSGCGSTMGTAVRKVSVCPQRILVGPSYPELSCRSFLWVNQSPFRSQISCSRGLGWLGSMHLGITCQKLKANLILIGPCWLGYHVFWFRGPTFSQFWLLLLSLGEGFVCFRLRDLGLSSLSNFGPNKVEHGPTYA